MVDASEECICPIHGCPSKRAACRHCNAAYMRSYMRRRRIVKPTRLIYERARRRALKQGIPFALDCSAMIIPEVCPALGIPLAIGGPRCDGSPSLDRIVPVRGYVDGNVRVVSDRANRLKSDRTLAELKLRALVGPVELRRDYALIAAYVERELLLAEVRVKANEGGRSGDEWANIAVALDKLFSRRLEASNDAQRLNG